MAKNFEITLRFYTTIPMGETIEFVSLVARGTVIETVSSPALMDALKS